MGSVTPIFLEIGPGLSHLRNAPVVWRLIDDQIPRLKDGLFHEHGVSFPNIEVSLADAPLGTSYRVLINGIPELQDQTKPGRVLVNEQASQLVTRGFDVVPATNPASDHPAAWIPAFDGNRAGLDGLTTWDESGYLMLVLSVLQRRKAAHFIGAHETRSILERLAEVFPVVVAELGRTGITDILVSEVLRRLVAGGISIRNLRPIVMALTHWACFEMDPLFLTEYGRAALRRAITNRLTGGQDQLVVFLLEPALEDYIHGASVHRATAFWIDLPMPELRAIIDTGR